MIKKFIQYRLEHAVRRYFQKNPQVKLIVVVGSVGKTSTKMAIGTVLSQQLRVRLHEGNHNSELSAPLAMLGVAFPDSIRNPLAWREVFRAIKRRLNEPCDVDVVVQELGTDGIGQIPHFGTYLRPDIAVVTAVSAEHMEFFGTLDAVAAEELAAVNFSKQGLINRDDVAGKYAADVQNGAIETYGSTTLAEYYFETRDVSLENGFQGSFITPGREVPLAASIHLVGDHSIRAAVAAVAVGTKLGLSDEAIRAGVSKIRAVSGRMSMLKGLQQALIIDDTYNSSPLAAASALRALYRLDVPQRIAVLGDMGELGASSAGEHATLGKLCDPSYLTHVVTVGPEAEASLAPAARANGCHVVSFMDAREAGAYVHKVLEPGAAVLFKGSQNRIFLEEAVKIVLHSTDDERKLVRQSSDWMSKKQAFFDSLQTDSKG